MRIHFSDNIIERIEDFLLPTHHRSMKPNGLYYSIEEEGDDTGWRAWCEAENFRCDRLKHQHEIEIDMSRVLEIGSMHAIQQFNRTYGVVIDDRFQMLKNIDWGLLAKDWAGIEVNPYLYSAQMEDDAGLWYYGWDCSSGCIWDLSIVRYWSYIGEYTPQPVEYE